MTTATEIDKLKNKVEQKKKEIAKVQKELDGLEKQLRDAGKVFMREIGLDVPAKNSKASGSSKVDVEEWLRETLANGPIAEQDLRDQYPGKRLRLPAYIANKTVKKVKGGKIALA